jgi:ABC-2 type transport system ATP-binding protein
MPPAIEFQALTRAFGRRTAVNNLTLDVSEGEIFGFLGRNGAGKTTTIRCLLGLARPTSGDVRVFGRSIVRDRIGALENVGALVESAAVYDYLTGEEHLRACALWGGFDASPSRSKPLLEAVGLAERARDRVSTYSRGMKQRLAIATAMLGNPKLLVLDEPTDGLDPVGTIEIRQLLKKLRGAGTTVFLSSHILGEVEATCDRVAILDGGHLKAVAVIQDVVQRHSLEEFFLKMSGAQIVA